MNFGVMNPGGWIILFWGVVTLANGNLGYQTEEGVFKPLAEFAGNTMIGWAFVIVGFEMIFNSIIFKTITKLIHFVSSRIKTETLSYKPDKEKG